MFLADFFLYCPFHKIGGFCVYYAFGTLISILGNQICIEQNIKTKFNLI
jgi:hypothetical protein